MNQKPRRSVVSCLGDEERVVGCVGALFQILDWNTAHSSSSSSSSSVTTITSSSSGKGVSKQQAPLPETREVVAMQRGPGVVARLMGLQSLPSPEEDCRLLLHHVDQVAALLSARTAIDCQLSQTTTVTSVPPYLDQPCTVMEAAAPLTQTLPTEAKTRRPSRRAHHCQITELTTAMPALPCLGKPRAVTDASAPLTPTPPAEEKTTRPSQIVDHCHVTDLTNATSAAPDLIQPRAVTGTEQVTPLTLPAEEKTRRLSQRSHHCHVTELTNATSTAPRFDQRLGIVGTEQAASLTLPAEEKTSRKSQWSHCCNITHPSTATSAALGLGQLIGVTPLTLPVELKTRSQSQGSHCCRIAELTVAMTAPLYLGQSTGAMEIEDATRLTMEAEAKRRRPSVYIKRGSTQESESTDLSEEMHDRRDKDLPLDSGQLLSLPLRSRSRPSLHTSSSNYCSRINLAPSHNTPAGLVGSGKSIHSPNKRKNRLKSSDERRKLDSIPKKEESFMKLLVKRKATRGRMIKHAEDQNRFNIVDSEIETKGQDLRSNLKTVLRHSNKPSSKSCTSSKVKRLSSTTANEIELADSEVSDSVYVDDFGQPSPVSILESPFQDESSQSSESLDSFPDSKYEVEYDNHRVCSSHGEAISLINKSLEPILHMAHRDCFDPSSNLLGLVTVTKTPPIVRNEQDYIKEVMKYMGTLLQEPTLINHPPNSILFRELERQADKWEWDTCLALEPSCRKQLSKQHRRLVFECVKEALILKLGMSSNPIEYEECNYLYSLEGEIERQVDHWRKARKVGGSVADDMVVTCMGKWIESYYYTHEAITMIEQCLYASLIEELLADLAMHT